MSIKSLVQIIIIILIILVIGGVYYKYFDTKKNFLEEINSAETNNQNQIKELEKKITDLELKNNELNLKIDRNKIITKEDKSEKINDKKEIKVDNDDAEKNKNEKKSISKKEIKNLVKDVEYISIDQKGNKFYLLANSAKSNANNVDILDLINVRGKITSDNRDTIYIVSDFAEYNSIDLNSKFYENVIINYEDKEITCRNFDINMETNKAIAYNNVVITDPKSIMRAGLVVFDLKTKNININPETVNKEIEVITN